MANIINPLTITGTDVDVSTPVPASTANSITGTPGTGGRITYGTYKGKPVPDPHQVWKFDVDLPPIPGIQTNPIVQQIEPGFDHTAPEQHPIGGRHFFIADFFDATELRLIFYDDMNHTPIEYIYAWKKLMRNYNSDTDIDDGTYKYPLGTNGYFQDIRVHLLDMQNKERYLLTYKWCFPTQMQPLRLDYEPSQRTVIAQSFAVNRIITKKISNQSSTANPSPISPAGAAIRNIPTLQI
jgi:hypothetical protein